MLIQPVQLGRLLLDSNLIQGPLAGYSCAPFRVITQQYGQPAFCVTEMISAKDLIQRHPKPKRYLGKHPEEGLLCYQLSGTDPGIVGQACQLVSEQGADLIDLNCGCPVNKIRAKQAGSRLLSTPEKIYRLVNAMKANTSAAVSIKIRISGKFGDHDDAAVIDAAEQAGVDFIIVHGRHWTERYDIPCQHDAIADIVRFAKVPIIANGDVMDYQSLQAIFQNTKCAGVMIARASVGQPWLFQQLRAADTDTFFDAPALDQTGLIFKDHIHRLIQLENEKLAILQSRKLAGYYARSLNNKIDFVVKAQQAETVKSLYALIDSWFFT